MSKLDSKSKCNQPLVQPDTSDTSDGDTDSEINHFISRSTDIKISLSSSEESSEDNNNQSSSDEIESDTPASCPTITEAEIIKILDESWSSVSKNETLTKF